MTISQFIAHITTTCSEIYNHRESQSIAYILAKELLGHAKIDVILNPNKTIDCSINIDEISRRLRDGEPIQYILGKTEFCGIEFEIGRGALIPRPETEELIDWIIRNNSGNSDNSNNSEGSSIRILDVGTGSGCIAISLAHKLPNSELLAIDIEPNAIEWARVNAKKNNINNITILHQDALSSLDRWSEVITKKPLDIVVSNPPYIPQQDIESMDLNVKGHEPHSALFVPDNDPLLFYKAIAISAQTLLRSGGELYFEIYESFASQIVATLSELGYLNIEIKEDINSKPRMCRCLKK